MKRTVLMLAALGVFLFAQAAQADWAPAKRLTWNSGQSKNPAIAADTASNIYVVWQDDTPGNGEIYYRKSDDGGVTWFPVNRLTWTAGESTAPAIAISSADTIHIVWSDNAPGNYEIYYKKSPDGGASWSGAKRLTWTSGNSSGPAMAKDLNNNIHIIWQDDTPGNYEIYHKKSTDGGATWSGAKRLTSTSGNSWHPAITTYAGNAIHVAWHDETPGLAEIYYMGSTDGGATWSAAKRLSWNSAESYDPAISIDSANDMHVLWSDDTPGNYEILYRRSENGGINWNPTQRLTWNADGSYEPAMAIDLKDAVHLVWDQGPQSNTEIYYKKSTDRGATWSAAHRLTWTSLHSYGPAIAIESPDIHDYVHLVWWDDTPGNFEIYYKTQVKN